MPDPAYTMHAVERQTERVLSQKQIHDTMTYGRIIESYDGKDIYARDRLRVVVAKDGFRIVTAYREDKDWSAKRKIRKARKHAENDTRDRREKCKRLRKGW